MNLPLQAGCSTCGQRVPRQNPAPPMQQTPPAQGSQPQQPIQVPMMPK
jgi:hypothetical protein